MRPFASTLTRSCAPHVRLRRRRCLSHPLNPSIVAASGDLELEASAAHLVLARDAAELEQSAAGVVAARSVEIIDRAVAVMLARNVRARNVRVLFEGRAAIAFGATAGAVLWRLGRRRPR